MVCTIVTIIVDFMTSLLFLLIYFTRLLIHKVKKESVF